MSVHSPIARRPAKRVSALVTALAYAGFFNQVAWAQYSANSEQTTQVADPLLVPSASSLLRPPSQNAASASAGYLNQGLRKYLGALSELEYSDLYGATLNLGLQSALGDNTSGLIQGRFGEKQRGLMVGLGVRLQDTLRINVLGEHLAQQRHFTGGNEDYWAKQNKVGVGIQHMPQEGLAKLVGLRYTAAKSQDKDLADTTLVTDTATLYEKYLIQNRFVGASSRELQAEATFDVGQQSEFLIFGGPAHTVSNDGADTAGQFTGGARYNYYSGGGKTSIGARTIADRTETSLSYEGSMGLGNTSWLAGVTQVSGMQSHNLTIFGLAINIPLGQGSNRGLARPARSHFGALDQGLLTAARTFRSSTVTGREKEISRTRIIAIDKTVLPAGTSIAANGAVSAPLSVAVLGITSVTLNGAPFTNTGQFSLTGGTLVINPNLITQPPVGVVHTYVVTMQNQGSGTTVATVNVSHGSVKIDSVVIVTDNTAPVNIAAPTVSATTGTGTTLNATINEAGTGYYLVQAGTVAAPSVASVVAANNSFAMPANIPASVAISGLADATTYKVYFVAKDTAGNLQSSVSSIAVTTLDTTAPTTTVAPSISGTTFSNTIFSATINEAGTGYYLVQAAAAAAPNVAAVQAGSTFAMTANTAATVTISGLSASTAYKIYFVAKDSASNVQTAVQSVTLTTAAAPPPPPDTTPNAFSFVDQTNVATSTLTESAAITVSGIDAATAISITGGEYQINGGAWATSAGSVTNGQTVKVRHTSSGSNSTTANTTLTIGGVSDTFSTTTVAAGDTTPPTTTAAPSISVAATSTTVSVTQTINEAGTGYYLVLPAASAAPTVAAVKAGTSFAMTANTPAVVAITGLTASTAYKYYFVAKDAANNDQAAVSSGLAITTTLPTGYIAQGGLTWMPNNATGTMNWGTANTYCTSTTINGQTGWRLPTKDELVSLYNSGALAGHGWTLWGTWSSLSDGAGSHYVVTLDGSGDFMIGDMDDLNVTCVR